MEPVSLISNSVRQLGRCDGCGSNLYSAPNGQPPRKPEPHSRCSTLQADIPMVLDARGGWIASQKPEHCPQRLAATARK